MTAVNRVGVNSPRLKSDFWRSDVQTHIGPDRGSELSEKAIAAPIDLAQTLKAAVIGMTTLEPYSYSNLSEYRPETLDDYEGRMDQAGAERLGRIADAASRAGVSVETVTVKSFSPYEAIVDTAKAKNST